MKLEVTINGAAMELDVPPTTRLLDLLRAAGLVGAKKGCGEGVCGSCTVLLDGRPVNSCLTFAGLAQGRRIETVEGLGTITEPHPLQRAFVDEGAVQCGYCTPGQLLSAKALLDRKPDPSEADIAVALDGNLCRCTGYVKTVRAVLSAARIMRGES